jgi:hypothetical protein
VIDGMLWVHDSGASWLKLARGGVRAVADDLLPLQQIPESVVCNKSMQILQRQVKMTA